MVPQPSKAILIAAFLLNAILVQGVEAGVKAEDTVLLQLGAHEEGQTRVGWRLASAGSDDDDEAAHPHPKKKEGGCAEEEGGDKEKIVGGVPFKAINHDSQYVDEWGNKITTLTTTTTETTVALKLPKKGPLFKLVMTGSCKDQGMLPITDNDLCAQAAQELAAPGAETLLETQAQDTPEGCFVQNMAKLFIGKNPAAKGKGAMKQDLLNVMFPLCRHEPVFTHGCINHDNWWSEKVGGGCDAYCKLRQCSPTGGYTRHWKTGTMGSFKDYEDKETGKSPVVACCCCGGGLPEFKLITEAACADHGLRPITDEATCEKAAEHLILTDQAATKTSVEDRPEGCYLWNGKNLQFGDNPANAGKGVFASETDTRFPLCTGVPDLVDS